MEKRNRYVTAALLIFTPFISIVLAATHLYWRICIVSTIIFVPAIFLANYILKRKSAINHLGYQLLCEAVKRDKVFKTPKIARQDATDMNSLRIAMQFFTIRLIEYVRENYSKELGEKFCIIYQTMRLEMMLPSDFKDPKTMEFIRKTCEKN